MKTFFFSIYPVSSFFFLFIQNCNNFRFSTKRTSEQGENTFLRKWTKENQVSIISSKYSSNGSFHKGEQVSTKSFPVFRTNTFWEAFYKFATCSDFENFQVFFGKTRIFFPKPQILILLRILLQSHSTAKVLQLSEKVNRNSDVNRNADVAVNAIGNHQEKTHTFKRKLMLS